MPLTKANFEKLKAGQIKPGQFLEIDTKQTAALLLTGYNLYSQGLLEDAQKVFESIAWLDPKNPYVNAALGSIYQKNGKYEAAVASYTNSLAVYPQDLNTLANRGEVYLKMGKLQEAAVDFRAAIELDPQHRHAAANRARMLVALTQEALQLVKEKGVEAVKEVQRRITTQKPGR